MYGLQKAIAWRKKANTLEDALIITICKISASPENTDEYINCLNIIESQLKGKNGFKTSI